MDTGVFDALLLPVSKRVHLMVHCVTQCGRIHIFILSVD